MRVNADFDQAVILLFDDIPWVDSPIAGVKRKMLDRIGGEVARATSLVSYAPNSQFSPHTHTGGEEFLVLEGVFQDETGDYPAGSYVRNPPETSHTPGSEEGCLMLVKLWQFDSADRTSVRADINESVKPDQINPTNRLLHEDAREKVRVESWTSNRNIQFLAEGGAEIFVLDGEIIYRDQFLPKYSWIREPLGSQINLIVGNEGTRVWIKTGHLQYAIEPS